MKKIILLFTIAALMLCSTACTENVGLPDDQPQDSAEELVLTADNVSEKSENPEKPEKSEKTEESEVSESESAVGSSDSLPQESASEVTSSAETVSESQSETESSAAAPETEPESVSLELDGYDCAVAYLGYTENADVNSVRKCAVESLTTEKYPFILDIADDKVILAGGGEIYCIVPADNDAKITVNSLEHGDELYSGDSSPILLCCNVSDIMPNVDVSITKGENTAKFSPFMSLRDGRLDVPEDINILDFSEYEF